MGQCPTNVVGGASFPFQTPLTFATSFLFHVSERCSGGRTSFVLKPKMVVYHVAQDRTQVSMNDRMTKCSMLVPQQLRRDFIPLRFAGSSHRALQIFQDEARLLGCCFRLGISGIAVGTD
ncbi:hypothetical protein AVEN_26856-1 [Araneus ventricosus]|uniref:Uncharacterized protein n=1 Tax=Araneus ventricosus TaxID=182803 RepID=A0A4Y2ULL3_ARAVE|nr:hypothetical protein AVEN_246498-1 [Araneus ventricosus]GBO12548.1 hypothetical protein AVEN_26856-1 [Araneus ventricosus]